jgi:diacylglycerol kinase family enzyme
MVGTFNVITTFMLISASICWLTQACATYRARNKRKIPILQRGKQSILHIYSQYAVIHGTS